MKLSKLRAYKQQGENMKKIAVYILILITITTVAYAGQKYNPHTDRWETVPDHWETQYNPHENSWSYQPRNAKVEYNAFENTWDWNSGHGNDRNDRNNGWY